MKIITLSPEQFQAYASSHRYRNFYQTTAYGNTMKLHGYEIHYLGFQDEHGTLLGATLLIFKEVFMGNKMAYAPRGMLFDYSNSFFLEELMTKLKKLLGKQGFIYLKIDPFIPVNIRSKDGSILNSNPEAGIILENLKSAGFQHYSAQLNFENQKPRFEAVVTLNQDIKEVYQNFDKRTRYKIKKAMRSGIEILEGTEENIKDFYEFIKRKQTHSLAYYQDLYNNFQEQATLYLAKLNTETFVINSKQLYEREMDRNDALAKQVQNQDIKGKKKRTLLNTKMESDKLLNTYKKDLVWATELLKENPKGILVGGALTITYDQAVYLFIEGLNPKFKELNSNYLLKWEILRRAKKEKFKYVNLNGITGNFEEEEGKFQGLNEMKLGYHAVITEYVGEFDFIINGLTYNLYRNLNKEKDKKSPPPKKQETKKGNNS